MADEKGGNYLFSVPQKVWEGEEDHKNQHARYRRTITGKILNLGPSQPYKSVTGEIRNAPYKYANPTGNPYFDMNLNIIPGMHPFQWDLAGAVSYATAPLLGILDGLADDSEVRHFVEVVKERYPASNHQILSKYEKGDDDGGAGGGGGKGKPDGDLKGSGKFGLGFPKSFFEQTIDAIGKGYEISVDPKGKLSYYEKVHATEKHKSFEKTVDAEGNSITFKALDPDGKLRYHNKNKYID